MYRVYSHHQKSQEYGLKGKNISIPESEYHYFDRSIYEYRFDYEISIVAYYVPGKKHLGKEAVETLLKMKDKLDDSSIRMLKDNAKFYNVEIEESSEESSEREFYQDSL